MQAFYWNCPGSEGRGGNWWNFLNGKVKNLQSVGFTALWLPPANKAAEAQSMGYDPYDFYDLGDFSQKAGTKTWFGDKGELMNLIASAHDAGMQVYADMVINHNSGGDATELNPMDGKTRWTKFTPASGIFPRNWLCFHPSSYETYDEMSFGDMPDLCHRDPSVYAQMIAIAQFLIEQIGFDGFRFDFVKGYGPWMVKAIAEVRYLNKDQKGFKPFCVGECWDSDRTIYDRRATGQSSGSRENINLTALAEDGIAGQRALSKVTRIDPNKIGFWGLSQGGWLAVLAAARSPNAAFAISVSAPLISPEEQMQFAMSNLMTIRGFPDNDIQQMLDTRKAWAGYVRGENTRAIAVAALQNAETEPWFDLVYLPKPSQLPREEQISNVNNDKDYDPVSTTTKVHVPLLFLYGASDPWVPVAKSVERLQSLSHVYSNIEYAVVADANHAMMFPSNETMEINQSTVQNDAPQAASYFMLLGSWLSRHVVAK